jgi:amino acid transporter
MPNHHVVSDGADAEKGSHAQYGYDAKGGAYEEPFVHGHATVAEASGYGGDTHRGLKSRHIQFLYVQSSPYLLFHSEY